MKHMGKRFFCIVFIYLHVVAYRGAHYLLVVEPAYSVVVDLVTLQCKHIITLLYHFLIVVESVMCTCIH